MCGDWARGQNLEFLKNCIFYTFFTTMFKNHAYVDNMYSIWFAMYSKALSLLLSSFGYAPVGWASGSM